MQTESTFNKHDTLIWIFYLFSLCFWQSWLYSVYFIVLCWIPNTLTDNISWLMVSTLRVDSTVDLIKESIKSHFAQLITLKKERKKQCSYPQNYSDNSIITRVSLWIHQIVSSQDIYQVHFLLSRGSRTQTNHCGIDP